jgi:hypothetical protein
MGVVEDLADQLARDALKAEKQLNDPNLVDEVASVLLAQSQIMQEAFMTAIRVRRSAVSGRQYIERKLAAGKGAGGAAKPPTMDNPDL